MTPTKIATCCYCGTRAALRFDKTRHELVCQSCGAPLHQLKCLPVTAPQAAAPVGPAKKVAAVADVTRPGERKTRQKRKKKTKPLRIRRLLSKMVDAVEDIFD